MLSQLTSAACAATLLCAGPCHSEALGDPAPHMPGFVFEEGPPTLAPFAFIEACNRYRQACRRKTGQSRVALTEGLEQIVFAINERVNHDIVLSREPKGRDDWKIDPPKGDCDDFAMTKRKLLMDQGIPPRAISLATGLTPEGVGHVVVVLRTKTGDLVLDNGDDWLKMPSETALQWQRIESEDNPRLWRKL